MFVRPRIHTPALIHIVLTAQALVLLTTPSPAIQLFWSGGSADLLVPQDTRAVLLVQADAAEVTLPGSWRLLWTADSSGLEIVPVDSSPACLSDTAKAVSVDPPASAADSAANQVTAHFCSAGMNSASTAYCFVDLVGGTKGKLKVVALDPADPDLTTVIESNEVRFNGGMEGEYEPVVLHTSSVHQSLQLRVTAVGSGLNAASSISIGAPDASWSLPLTVTSRSHASVTGIASVAALLPECQTTVGSATGAFSGATLAADEEPASESPQSCQAQYFEELLQPPPPLHGYTIQPKDFAFARGFADESSNRYALHFFYIRHNYWYYPPAPAIQHPELDEKNIGHIWTTDFNSWYGPDGLNKPDTLALRVRPGKFDEFHVWAPTIIKPEGSPVFWMFYTGVGHEEVAPGVFRDNQRIGRATSTDLITWTPADDPVLTAPQVPWASKNPPSPYSGSQQLRDPFVMEDPINPGQWLMYFVAVDSIRAPNMAVGVARSADLLNWIPLEHPFSSTERPTFQGATNRVESPHVFARNGQWWMQYTVNGDQVFFETSTSATPTDTVATQWSEPVWLRGVSEGQPPELQYWHASEYLQIYSQVRYLAAFDDNASSIDIKGIFPPANAAVDSFRLDCPEITGVGNREDAGAVRMAVSSLRWGAPEVGLRLELPSMMSVRLAVYDIAGRRRATLLNRDLPGGVTEVKWDGRDQRGARVASGIYFVRLTFAGGTRRTKIVLLR